MGTEYKKAKLKAPMKGAKLKEPGHRIPSRKKLRESPCGGCKIKGTAQSRKSGVPEMVIVFQKNKCLMLAIVLTCKLETLVISQRFYFGIHPPTQPPPLAKQWNPPTLTILKWEEEEEDQLVSKGVLEPYEHKCAVRTTLEL